MLRLFRWLTRIATVLIVFCIATVAVLYWFFSRSIPDYSEDFAVAGINAPVEIVRDNANVPHIFGQSDDDVYFGLGMSHAQDRLWQMLLLRRTAQGRLSELFGQATVSTDRFLRRLDLYPLAVKSVAVQDDYALKALEAYSAGVNAWLKEINDGARGRGAPEFWLFEPNIAPWQPADSIAIGKLMALSLTDHARYEIERAQVSRLLPEERVYDILPDTPGQAIASLPEYASLFDAPIPTFAQITTNEDGFLSPIKPRGRHRVRHGENMAQTGDGGPPAHEAAHPTSAASIAVAAPSRR